MSYRIYSSMIRYNANTRGVRTGDCVKRALSVAYSMNYDDVATELNRINKKYGYNRGYTREPVFTEFIKSRGDHFESVSGFQTVEEFCEEHPTGVYLVLTNKNIDANETNHIIAIVDGDYYDSWDSGSSKVLKYAVVTSGKSGRYELDYFEIFKRLLESIHTYIDTLRKKLPDCMYLKIYSFDQLRELDTAKLELRCLYLDNVPKQMHFMANKYMAHTIKVKLNPRLSEEENLANVDKKVQKQIYNWIYPLRKEILDTIGSDSFEKNPKFRGSKSDLMRFPDWARPLITAFWDDGNSGMFRYTLYMERLPEDPHYNPNSEITLYADTLTDLKSKLNAYKTNYFVDEY